MIKLEQRGFTLVELLISIGILGVIAPLLVLALFQIITFTERGRAGFEAQADTRNASTWISKDIEMAQGTTLVPVFSPVFPPPPPINTVSAPNCSIISPLIPGGGLFTWTDLYKDRNNVHDVSYCLETNVTTPNTKQCVLVRACLVRNYIITDKNGITITDSKKIIAWDVESIDFFAAEWTRPSPNAKNGTKITITIQSTPDNRFGVSDQKTLEVIMRPTL